MTQFGKLSILQAAAQLEIKYTTARNIINYWKETGELYRSDGDKAKATDQKQHVLRKMNDSTRESRRRLMIVIEVPDAAT